MTGVGPRARISVAHSGHFSVIGASAAPTGLLQSTLDLPGGLLTYDVRVLSAPPFAEIDDPLAAVHWVARVYGASVAGQLESPPSEAVTGDLVSTEHNYSPDPSAANLARVALGQWLWRFWPAEDCEEVAPLDEGLLRLELAALAWDLDDYFTVLQPASTFLDGTLEMLLELASHVAADPTAADHPLRQIVVGALDAAVAGPSGALVTEDEDLLDSLDDLLTRMTVDVPREADEEGAAESIEDWLRERASARSNIPKAARQDHYALTAGSQEDMAGVDTRSGRFSVDWMQVPPRCLDWDEGTVSWKADPTGDDSGTWLLTVRVAASNRPDPEPVEVILARVYLPDGTEFGNLPVLTFPLEREVGDYAGSGVIRGGDLSALVVDVFSSSSVRRPLIGPEARDGAAREREEARRLIVDRALSIGLSHDGINRPFAGEPREDV